MNNSSMGELCYYPKNYSSSYDAYTIAFIIITSFINFVSFCLWLVYHSKYPSLVQRSCFQVGITSILWEVFVFTTPGVRVSIGVGNMTTCFSYSLLYGSVVPLSITLQTFRVCFWFLQLQYNKLCYKKFEIDSVEYYAYLKGYAKTTRGRETIRSSLSSDHKTLFDTQIHNSKKLVLFRQMLRRKNSNLIFLCLIILELFLFSFVAKILCSKFRSCNYLSREGYFYNNLIMGTFGLVSLIAVIFVHRETKDLPDPYLFLRECKVAICFPFAFGGVSIFLIVLHPQNNPDITYSISPAILFDYGIGFSFFIVIVYPLRVIFPWFKQEEQDLTTLNEILDSEVGLSLFKGYLVYELSTENLNFYLVATKWKESFHKLGYFSSFQVAQNIVSRWIADPEKGYNFDHVYINIEYPVAKKIRQSLENDDIDESLFDEAINAVYILIWSNSFPNFKKTTIYKQYIGRDQGLDVSHLSL
eukprot:snap_masked-scaffold_55-processed-gene-0.25-mRNA-1 protein AED:1.00 eAED:1.00 QI:0/-1/0/0/-1/1/1/0/471